MTKIDIISGFLGAGKTTFIKKMIDEAFKGEQIVLIENEFGEVGIDGGFLKDAGIQITEMNSGCICCSLVGDFGKNLNEVITKYHPDRILIEPSGVGKLSDVMKSVIDIEKEQPVKLNALVTVVNALKASKQMKAFGEFFNNQIEYATTVILSRSQNATPEQLEFCVKQIQALNPKASVITTDWDAIKGEQILKTMEGQDNLEMKVLAEARHAQDEAEHHHHHDHDEHEHHHDHDEHEHHHDHDEHEHHGHHHHHHGEGETEEYGIGSFVYYRRRPFAKEKFEDWLDEMPKGIIRSKGIIWAAENNNDAYMFEQAGKQINIANAGQWVATAPRRVRAKMMKEDPTLVEDWDEKVGDRMIKVVFIGHDMDKEAIIKSLDDCLAY